MYCVPRVRNKHIIIIIIIIIIYLGFPYKRKWLTLRSSTNASMYEACNGASLAQSFKYNFSFPSTYRLVEIDAINPVLRAKANLKREPPLNMAMHRK